MSTTLEQQFYQELKKGNTKKALYIVKLMRDDVNKLHRGKSPLVHAREFENEDVINALKEKGAKEEVISQEIMQSLSHELINVVQMNDGEKFSKLIDAGANLEGKDEHDWTPLIMASACGHVDMVNKLIEEGANINCKEDYKTTALIEATTHGHDEVIKILVENGADINQKDEFGNSVLTFAGEETRKIIFEAAKNRYKKEPEKNPLRGQDMEI